MEAKEVTWVVIVITLLISVLALSGIFFVSFILGTGTTGHVVVETNDEEKLDAEGERSMVVKETRGDVGNGYIGFRIVDR